MTGKSIRFSRIILSGTLKSEAPQEI
jgi:hypothetical protein